MPMLCWITIAAAPPAQVLERVDLAPQVTELRYHSSVLDRELNLLLVTPSGAVDLGELPVAVFLHGHGRNPRTLYDMEATHATLLSTKVVLVQPNGLAGWYLDSRQDSGPQYQEALTEAIALATGEFGLTTDPQRRGIGGWSMGGFGAARYAADHPDQFSALGTILGLLDFPNADLPLEQNHSVPALFGPAAGWPQITPLAGVDKLRGWAHWQGTGDAAFDRTMNERWSARLGELGVEHTFRRFEGGHTYAVVAEALPEVLRFFETSLTN